MNDATDEMVEAATDVFWSTDDKTNWRKKAMRAALSAALAHKPVGEWQPIDTAPKDGTKFLGYFAESGDYGIVSRHDPGGATRNPKHHYECWVVDGSPAGPTHWRHLDAAPAPSPNNITVIANPANDAVVRISVGNRR